MYNIFQGPSFCEGHHDNVNSSLISRLPCFNAKASLSDSAAFAYFSQFSGALPIPMFLSTCASIIDLSSRFSSTSLLGFKSRLGLKMSPKFIQPRDSRAFRNHTGLLFFSYIQGVATFFFHIPD